MLRGGGLDVGQRLMASDEANVRGYFEDMDFYEFHVAVCQSQGFDPRGFILQRSIPVQAQFVASARAMVEERRRRGRPWGWKDPRTTLFLDFWAGLVPELRFLLLFRRPWEVVDSCFRVGDPIYRRHAGLVVRLWPNHNHALLDFLGRFPERCLLIESYAAAVSPRRLTDAIAAKFGDYLGPIGELYEADLFRCDPSTQQQAVLADYFPEAIELYQQLRSRASLSADSQGASAGQSPDPASLDWGLQFWADLRNEERARKQACDELVRLQTSLAESQASLAALQECHRQRDAQVDQLRREADSTRSQIEQLRREADSAGSQAEQLRREADSARSQAEQLRREADSARSQAEQLRREAEQIGVDLARVQMERDRTATALSQKDSEGHCLREELDRVSADLERTTLARRVCETQIAWMETSKFWKLRRVWLHLKSPWSNLKGRRQHGAPATMGGEPGAGATTSTPPNGRLRVSRAEVPIPWSLGSVSQTLPSGPPVRSKGRDGELMATR
jgi:hypothetical protein